MFEKEISTVSLSQPSGSLGGVDLERKKKEELKSPYCRDSYTAGSSPNQAITHSLLDIVPVLREIQWFLILTLHIPESLAPENL